MKSKLKIFCYAIVAEDAGSVASANFLLLRELADLGHHIDLIVIPGYMHPGKLLGHKNIRPIFASLPLYENFILKYPSIINNVFLARLIGLFVSTLYRRLIARRYFENSIDRAYDLTLFLGTLAFFRSKNKTVSWPQGSPHTEWRSVRKEYWKNRYCGLVFFIALNFYYFFHCRSFEKKMKYSDYFIVGSNNSRDWLYGIGKNKTQNKVHVLPYSIDFEKLGKKSRSDSGLKTIISLGRIVPRKRIDLTVEAFEHFSRDFPDWKLKVIGGFRYSTGYLKIINSVKNSNFSYSKQITRDAALIELKRSTILLQTSENEDFGPSVAEALACGVPVVVGSTNGTKDYIGNCGEVFGIYDVPSILKAMKKLANRAESENISDMAVKQAKKEFDSRIVTGKLLKILTKILED